MISIHIWSLLGHLQVRLFIDWFNNQNRTEVDARSVNEPKTLPTKASNVNPVENWNSSSMMKAHDVTSCARQDHFPTSLINNQNNRCTGQFVGHQICTVSQWHHDQLTINVVSKQQTTYIIVSDTHWSQMLPRREFGSSGEELRYLTSRLHWIWPNNQEINSIELVFN